MLKPATWERIRFGSAFLAGLVFCFILLPALHESKCLQERVSATETNDASNPHYTKVDSFTEKNKNQNSNRSDDGTPKIDCDYLLKAVICAGDMKLTDLALVFFTYSLFVVGWFTLRSNERTLEDLQRAYLWPGFAKNKAIKGGGRKWLITVHNTGQTAGVIQKIYFAVATPEDYAAGKYEYALYDKREDVIPHSVGEPYVKETGLDFSISEMMICCGWIEYQDIFGHIRKQGWKHRLLLTKDAAGNWSQSLPGCYSATYRPWTENKPIRKN